MRSGLFAQKIGMTRIFTEAGEHVPVTVLKLDNCQVVAHRTQEANGYTAVQLGAGSRKVKNVTRAQRGHFAKAQVEPKAKLVEFRVTPEQSDRVGAELDGGSFRCRAICRRDRDEHRQGLHRRHETLEFRVVCAPRMAFRSRTARHGSTGNRQDPGKTFKGKKMAGHMATSASPPRI